MGRPVPSRFQQRARNAAAPDRIIGQSAHSGRSASWRIAGQVGHGRWPCPCVSHQSRWRSSARRAAGRHRGSRPVSGFAWHLAREVSPAVGRPDTFGFRGAVPWRGRWRSGGHFTPTRTAFCAHGDEQRGKSDARRAKRGRLWRGIAFYPLKRESGYRRTSELVARAGGGHATALRRPGLTGGWRAEGRPA